MARIAPRVPESTDILCEGCGYVLNGLPETGRCPECGKPIEQSLGNQRSGPAWEKAKPASHGAFLSFLATTANIIFRPTTFYRTLTVRGPVESARRFARFQWMISSALFGFVSALHLFWYMAMFSYFPWLMLKHTEGAFMVAFAGFTLFVYFALDGITRLAARLTNWEGTYRGLRLPYETVLRGIYFHSAHYLPIALASFALVGGYNLLLEMNVINLTTASAYLYALSAFVIVSAIYLFNTYWIGMRNMMYANR